jgi:hypothetical protein
MSRTCRHISEAAHTKRQSQRGLVAPLGRWPNLAADS